MDAIAGAEVRPRALILAAGMGCRLDGDATEQLRNPKALLEFGGKSLLARHVDILRGAGITSITVIIGFHGERIRAALADLHDGPPVSVLVNPDFREGSVVSLYAGREVLRTGDPVILMDADVLYDRRLMARLVDSVLPNCLLLDRAIEPGDEPVKLCVRDGRIVDFSKRPSLPHEWHGESVGFFRFSAATAAELADRTEDYVASGRRALEYEEPIRDMIIASNAALASDLGASEFGANDLGASDAGASDSRAASSSGRFGFEDISGLPWTEIDFPEDVLKARALVSELVG
jgi:choline kinase